MPRNSNEDLFKVSRSEGIALLRWSFTVVGAVMSTLLVAASQAGENMSFYLMTITLFKLSLMFFLVLSGAVFATLVASLMGHSDRDSRDRWARVQRIKLRLGRIAFLTEKIRRLAGRLLSWSAFALAILIGAILPASMAHFGTSSLKSDIQISRELQTLQISAFKYQLQAACEEGCKSDSP